MDQKQSTVEINGKIYNMKSGQIIGNQPISSIAQARSVGKVDGFVGDNSSSTHTISHQHKASKAQVNHTARKPTKSSTLVRNISRPSKQHVTTVHRAKSGGFVAKVGDSTSRSDMIKKFHVNHSTNQQPAHLQKIHTAIEIKKPNELPQKTSLMTIQELEDKFRTTITDPFEEAMREATNHIHELHNVEGPSQRIKKIFHPFGSKARTSLTAVIVIFVFVIGVYQTIPSVKVKMASLQASIPASLPSYKPAGFGIAGPIKAEPGKVTVNYRSNTENSEYKLTQQASNWSSQALLNNQVLATAKPFQTYQQNGKTVYVYDNNNAVWVDAGILYSIESNTSLDSDQLLKIAESL